MYAYDADIQDSLRAKYTIKGGILRDKYINAQFSSRSQLGGSALSSCRDCQGQMTRDLLWGRGRQEQLNNRVWLNKRQSLSQIIISCMLNNQRVLYSDIF